jgi:mono/diheme cytochrome c family protein
LREIPRAGKEPDVMTNPTRRLDAAAPRQRLAAIAFGLSTALSGGSALAADADHGEQLARRWCASCHIVSADQTRGADNVPAFASIAKRPGFAADKIARFLMDPHPKMPDMQPTRSEAADLGAYIASLAR